MLNYTDYFSASYDEARQKFRQAATAAGGRLFHYTHPNVLGALCERLTIDVAHVGNVSGPCQLIMVSGTHGLEGFAGSALQIAWLKQLNAAALHKDVGVLLVHGLNPYGFSHGWRTTVNGVDLNRNFIDHASPPALNPHYVALQPYLAPRQWDAAALSVCHAAIADFRRNHGDDVYFNAFAGGQYRYTDGVCFGGFAPEWENLTLRHIVGLSVGHAEHVAVIDWHTGIGDYGEPFYLNFAAPDSDAHRQAATWWGQTKATDSRPHGRATPSYQGLVFQGIASSLPRSAVAGGVIEFGTRGPIAGDLAIRQELWLRNYGHQAPEDTRAQLHADLLDSLSPVSSQWRGQVLENGLPIITATLDGLALWPAST